MTPVAASFPVGDPQAWIATAIAIAAMFWLVRGVVRSHRGGGGCGGCGPSDGGKG